MKLLLVDDEPLVLKSLYRETKEACPDAEIICADCGKKALEIIEQENIDVVFLDVEMPDINGLVLCRKMKEQEPKLNVIFVTGYSEYAVEAAQEYFSGYFLKPVSAEKIKEGLEHLRYPVHNQKGFYIQCFGQFGVFYDGKRVSFARSKTMELLAYLIDLRGGVANTMELCEVLWPDEIITGVQKSYLRNLVSDLRKTLQKYGAEDAFKKQFNSFGIDPSKIKCDYYDYLNGDVWAINTYDGEYMSQYSWALIAREWKY